jgi:hypothetical protein
MIVSDLYKIAKNINETIGDTEVNISINLDPIKYENIQQDVYKLQNNTLYGYIGKDKFDVILMNVKFLFKKKN